MKTKLYPFFCFCVIVFTPLFVWAETPTLSVDRDQSDVLKVFAFSADGKLFGTVTNDMTIKIWNVRTGKLTAALAGNQNVVSIAFGGNLLASGHGNGTITIWDLSSKQKLFSLRPHFDAVTSLAFTADGKRLTTASLDDSIKQWNVTNELQLVKDFQAGKEGVLAMALSPDLRIVAGGGVNGNVKIWEAVTGNSQILPGHDGPITAVAFNPTGSLLVMGSERGTITLWRLDPSQTTIARPISEYKMQGSVRSLFFRPDGQTIFCGSGSSADRKDFNISQTSLPTEIGNTVKLEFRALCAIYSFRDGSWAVLDTSGRYDASNGGDVPWINWMVGNQPVILSQLKERYYEPGLLAKHTGFVREPLRNVNELKDVKLFPSVTSRLAPGSTNLLIKLTNRGGGLGKTQILVNGSEVLADAKSSAVNSQAASAELAVDLSAWKQFFKPGQANEVEIRVYNSEGYLSSRDVKLTYNPPPEAAPEPPHLWAIVAGVSDYSDPQLTLRYAAKDAEDFASSLEIGAKHLFSPDRVHLTLLTTSQKPGTIQPTRENLAQAFKALARAKSTDILLIYLSGHGVTHGGQDGDYYYLTKDATTASMDDPDLRKQRTLSSKEIADLIREIPANKRVLILDTCAAGRLAEKLSEGREMSSSAERAFDRMKDRTGTFILAGAAADRVSYEASRYGQGLLTYSLLAGMRGAALAVDSTVDVNTLFQYARDEVPNLARGIGGIQSPVIAFPTGGASFAIGIIAPDERAKIPFHAVRAVILRSNFQDEDQLVDVLSLGRQIDSALRNISSRGSDSTWVFWDAADGPDAFNLAGRYKVTDNTLTVRVVLFKANVRVGEFTVSGMRGNLDAVVGDITKEINTRTTH